MSWSESRRRASLGSVVHRALNAVLSGLWYEYQARRAAHRLKSFDDALLRDLGISRGQIDDVVRQGLPHQGLAHRGLSHRGLPLR